MPTPLKTEIINDLTQKFQSSSGIYFTRYTGMNVAKITELRRKFRENEISYHLLKECITDPKGYDQLKQIFPAVIDRLNEWVAYKKIGKKLEPKDLKAITAFVNKNNFEEFLHYNHYYEWPEDEKEDEKLGKGRIQLNPKYYRLVKQVLDDLGT